MTTAKDPTLDAQEKKKEKKQRRDRYFLYTWTAKAIVPINGIVFNAICTRIRDGSRIIHIVSEQDAYTDARQLQRAKHDTDDAIKTSLLGNSPDPNASFNIISCSLIELSEIGLPKSHL